MKEHINFKRETTEKEQLQGTNKSFSVAGWGTDPTSRLSITLHQSNHTAADRWAWMLYGNYHCDFNMILDSNVETALCQLMAFGHLHEKRLRLAESEISESFLWPPSEPEKHLNDKHPAITPILYGLLTTILHKFHASHKIDPLYVAEMVSSHFHAMEKE